MKSTLLCSVALMFASACEPTWFAVEIESSEVCIVDLPVVFPRGAPGVPMEVAITEDDLGINLGELIELDVSLTSASLAPTGDADLRFADRIDIRIGTTEDPSLPMVPLVELAAGELAPEGGLYGEPESLVDVTDYVTAADVLFELELKGRLPKRETAAAMDVCVNVKAGYRQTFGDKEPAE